MPYLIDFIFCFSSVPLLEMRWCVLYTMYSQEYSTSRTLFSPTSSSLSTMLQRYSAFSIYGISTSFKPPWIQLTYKFTYPCNYYMILFLVKWFDVTWLYSVTWFDVTWFYCVTWFSPVSHDFLLCHIIYFYVTSCDMIYCFWMSVISVIVLFNYL